MLLIIMIFLNIFKSASYVNNYLLRNIKPNAMRKNIHDKLNDNYKYLSYEKVKKIMHSEMNNIDIYGDNTHEKNIEHVFPQYLFKLDTNKNMMKSDLHNLYLCNKKINTLRQNFKYVGHDDYIESGNDKLVDQQGNSLNTEDMFKKQGYMMLINKKSKKFIPTEYSRGMISRSLAYFSIKYNYVEQLKDVIDIQTLIEWNLKDPVSNEEYHKNIITYKYQNNLNPFIIDSDLMIYAFSDMFELSDEILEKKKVKILDPLYSINLLLDKNKKNEKEINLLQKRNDRIKKNNLNK